ncbi:hypothetical protein VNO77_01026 [Canavalia gladiata]|uniref:Leucine-rich repeat-containing N-terminal plant-type domain-containing protein n=1 Tax=Canavalia gladiata TaxID=3824 RepID=A0AAN9MQH2_CANGL
MIVQGRFLQRLAEFIAIVCLLTQRHVVCDGGFNARCINSEADALLLFKGGLKDPSNRLSSWAKGKDCCQWKGVECNTTTGHVISLNLHCANSLDKLQGELISLLDLPYLSTLNLSGNDFMQYEVPAFIGSMKNLRHLDLSNANFKGKLLYENLVNLSRLESLDLSGKGNSLKMNDLKWLHGFSSLTSLDLSEVDLSSNANDWFLYIGMLPSLVTLRLSSCELHILPHSLPEGKFDSLVTLDLSFNYFTGTIPDWLFENCLKLQHLDLSNNQLQGSIPDSIVKLTSLVTLDLSYNELFGSIPSTLSQNRPGTNPCLKELHLSNNQLNGSLERSLVQLPELVVLDLAQNKFESNITEAHLANLKGLRVLDLSFNHIRLNVSKNWVPPFQLEIIGLGNCQLGPQFPKWIQTQKKLSHIDISKAGISDTVPDWFWDLSPSIEYLNLSSNFLRGCGHDFSQKFKIDTLDLSNNNFSCALPHLPPNTRILNLAKNSFYGNMSRVCEVLGVNNSLGLVDLSSNNLSGDIPDCWTYGKQMVVLDLAHNNFSGSIPDSVGSLTSLNTLTMDRNNLSGKIPDSLKGCHGLIVLTLGSNRFWGTIPSWIGVEMQMLKLLALSMNWFEGNIPTTLCLLKSLSFLDLSQNRLTGAIPSCVFDTMATEYSESFVYDPYITYLEHLSLAWKGRQVNFGNSRILPYLKLIDLSSNLLTEGIPIQVTKLVGLVAFNLSRNQLSGSIPSGIGELIHLESLDLSRNQFSCAIPTTMARLSFLALLDLSHNHLSGKIPFGTQLQSFDMSSYEGNPHLCGLPLTQNCPTHNSFEEMHCNDREGNIYNESDGKHDEDKKVDLEIYALFRSFGVGFFTGFWLFWGSLFIIKSWRYAYFLFLDDINRWIYVTIFVALAKLQRKFHILVFNT